MEEVYSSTSKVLIDSESSGNLLYLPIDKLAGEAQTQTKRKVKETSAYDQIELESQQSDSTSDSQSRSTGSRQGRY